MRVLVTGHGGFIGRHLCARLRRRRPDTVLFGLDHARVRLPGVKSRIGDVRDTTRLKRLLRKVRPDWIFHFAGAPANGNWSAMITDQLLPAAALMETVLALPGPGPRVILPGSAAEYGALPASRLPARENGPTRPVNAYGVAKRSQTVLAETFARRGLNVVLARIFNVLGPGLHPNLSISSFCLQIARIERGLAPAVLKTGNLSPKRDFVDVEDAVRAALLLAQKGRRGEVYNICSGRSVSIREVIRRLLHLARKPIRVETRLGRIRAADIRDMRGSFRKLRKATGWRPRANIDKTLAAMLEHARAQLAR